MALPEARVALIGPDSAAAVSLAERLVRNSPGRYVQLLGNHEGQRFTDLHLEHADPLPERTLFTIRHWWSTRRVHLALALDTEEFGAVLVTRAGLSPTTWHDIGAPATAREAPSASTGGSAATWTVPSRRARTFGRACSIPV